MSDAPDRDARTEDPTEKRVVDAYERGDMPVSQEVALAANFLAVAALGAFAGPQVAAYLGSRLTALFEHIDLRLESTADLAQAGLDLVGTLGLAILPLVAAVMLVGVVSSLGQTGLAPAADRLVPSLDRLSPARGAARIFGRNARGDLLKSLFKIGAGAVVVALWFEREWQGFVEAGATDARGLGPLLIAGLARLFFAVGAVHAIIAAADLFWVRLKWRLEHRMTKEEVKREHREAEMDPALKSPTSFATYPGVAALATLPAIAACRRASHWPRAEAKAKIPGCSMIALMIPI